MLISCLRWFYFLNNGNGIVKLNNKREQLLTLLNKQLLRKLPAIDEIRWV